MRKFLTVITIFGSLTFCHAQSYVARLNGAQEVPSNGSPGFGIGDFTLSGTTLSANGGYDEVDLYGAGNSVTVHEGAVGVNGPAILTLTLETPDSSTGSFDGSGTLTSQEITDLNDGDLYVIIATLADPNGLIRGQIEEVPEPSTLALLGAGFMAVLARRRQIQTDRA